MYQPKFSFITATFNSAKTVEQTISSIASQTYSNVEHSEKDNGICDAVGKGTLMATGDYINILGSDDCLVSSTILEKVVEELQDEPTLLMCDRYNVDEETGMQQLNGHGIEKDTGFPFCITEASFISKSALEKYPYDRTYQIASDRKILIQIVLDKSMHIKLSDLPVAFEGTSGASRDVKNLPLIIDENNRIYKELNLDFHMEMPKPRPQWKVKYSEIERRVKNAIPPLRKLYLRLRGRNENEGQLPMLHTCDNKICRWCGRL